MAASTKERAGSEQQDLNLVSRLVYVNLQRTQSPLVDGKDNQMIPVKQSLNQDLNLSLGTRNELHECSTASKKTNPPLQAEGGLEGVRGWKRRWNVGNDLLSQRWLQKYHRFSLPCGSDCGSGLDKLCLTERRASQTQTTAHISERAPWAPCRVGNVRSSTCRAIRGRKTIELRVFRLSEQSA